MPFYRNILKQAWTLTWRNKYLWWFGVFAALLGNGGELEVIFNNSGDPGGAMFPSWQRISSTGVFSPQTFTNVGNLFKHDTLNIIALLIVGLIVLAIFLFIVWLVIVSQAALVNNSAAIFKQKKNSFQDGWLSGRVNFWPVFSINVLSKVIIYILLAVVGLPMIYWGANFGVGLFYVLALVIMVPVVIIISFIAKYAVAYAVINKYKIGLAIGQSWQLFKENWLISFEMAVILFFINLLVGLGIVLAVLTLAVPFLFLGLLFFYAFSALGSWLVAVMALIFFLAVVIFIGAALSVFQISAWTGLFLELDKKGGTSKLIRVVNDLVKA